jgi:hypothetical protein
MAIVYWSGSILSRGRPAFIFSQLASSSRRWSEALRESRAPPHDLPDHMGIPNAAFPGCSSTPDFVSARRPARQESLIY